MVYSWRVCAALFRQFPFSFVPVFFWLVAFFLCSGVSGNQLAWNTPWFQDQMGHHRSANYRPSVIATSDVYRIFHLDGDRQLSKLGYLVTGFPHCLSRSSEMTGFNYLWPALFSRSTCAVLGFTGFNKVLPSFTGFYWVLLSFTGFYWVFTGFLLGFTGFYWVLLGFT